MSVYYKGEMLLYEITKPYLHPYLVECCLLNSRRSEFSRSKGRSDVSCSNVRCSKIGCSVFSRPEFGAQNSRNHKRWTESKKRRKREEMKMENLGKKER